MEENSTNTTTTTTTETKQNWFKAHMTVCIISAVVVIAAVVAIVIIVNRTLTPEDVVKTYVAAMNEGKIDKIMNIADFKGACAWAKCKNDASKFEEEYKKCSDDDAKTYEQITKSTLETAMKIVKNIGKLEMSINNIETPEELAKDLYKVKASVKMKVSVFGVNQEQDQDIALIVYKGKYVCEATK